MKRPYTLKQQDAAMRHIERAKRAVRWLEDHELQMYGDCQVLLQKLDDLSRFVVRRNLPGANKAVRTFEEI